jgi:DNA-binding beta-propeller fold protein YncE
MKKPNFLRQILLLKHLKGLFLVSLIALMSACGESDVTPINREADVIIINEGNFGSADGTLSTYTSSNKAVNLSVFAGANGFPFAATIQNVLEYDGNYYAITNNTDKVEVFKKEDFSSVATIKPSFGAAVQFATPFSFAAVGTQGYVSNWGTFNFTTFVYDNPSLVKINLTNFSITSKIALAAQPQHLLAIGSKIYISLVGSNQIAVLNTSNDQFETPITVEQGPDKMLIDKNGKLWVMCNSGYLVRINPNTNAVEATIPNVQSSGFNEKMAIDGDGETLYYLSSTGFNPSTGAVYAIDITATTAPNQALISGNNFYGVGIDPVTDIIYVGDNKNFQSNGIVIRYQTNGTTLDTLASGRGPNGFLFRK